VSTTDVGNWHLPNIPWPRLQLPRLRRQRDDTCDPAATPDGFIALAFARRAQAMTTGKLALLDTLYDSANPQLRAFEHERAAFMAELGARWNGGKLLGYSADATLIDLRRSGATATARVYERVRLRWIPQPLKLSREAVALRRRYPQKFCSTTPCSPCGAIWSVFGNRHEIGLEWHASGWRIVRDAYEEPDLYGASPDLVAGAWSAVNAGLPANGELHVAAMPVPARAITKNGGYDYNWTAAKDYAISHWCAYNPSYCNYNACGGDCANFVSQCLRAGAQIDGGSWYTYGGGCGRCAHVLSSNAGTTTWVNNMQLRNWVVASGRGVAMSSIGELGVGDLVNYDANANGNFNHITIVTDPVYSLVCAHNSDRCNVYWTLGEGGDHRFTWVNLSYWA
jgi:Putative amidase domain